MIVIRNVTANDAEAVARLLRDAFAHYRRGYTDAGYRATVVSADEITRRLNEGPIWIATAKDGAVGTVSGVTTADGLYIRSMAVAPIAQRKGVGIALMAHVEQYARDAGVKKMYLSTTPFLEARNSLVRALRIQARERCTARLARHTNRDNGEDPNR